MDRNRSIEYRQSSRSNVLLSAAIVASWVSIPIKIRDLSSSGALIEAKELLLEGAEIIFRKGELRVSGRVVWTKGKQAGLAFAEPISPQALLRHIPAPRPRIQPDSRRPAFVPSHSMAMRPYSDTRF